MSQAFKVSSGGSVSAVETLTGNTGGAVGPTAGNINVVGDDILITVTGNPGTSTLTINSIVTMTTVDSANPYVVQPTDYYLRVRTAIDAFTIQLPDTPTVGRVFIVKDVDGSAFFNKITVTTVSGGENIDGALTFVMDTNWQAAQFIYNGAYWEVF